MITPPTPDAPGGPWVATPQYVERMVDEMDGRIVSLERAAAGAAASPTPDIEEPPD